MVVVAGVGHIVLGNGGEVGDGVGEGVGAAESEDKARVGRRVGEGNVAAGVRQEGPSVPRLSLLAPCATHAGGYGSP